MFFSKPDYSAGIFFNLDRSSCLHILQHGHLLVGGIAKEELDDIITVFCSYINLLSFSKFYDLIDA